MLLGEFDYNLHRFNLTHALHGAQIKHYRLVQKRLIVSRIGTIHKLQISLESTDLVRIYFDLSGRTVQGTGLRRLNIGISGWNPTRDMDMCPHFVLWYPV